MQAMRALAEDPAERRRLGTAARGALEDYRPEKIAARLEDAYAAVLGRERV